jgi:hypothetical protein
MGNNGKLEIFLMLHGWSRGTGPINANLWYPPFEYDYHSEFAFEMRRKRKSLGMKSITAYNFIQKWHHGK